MQESHVDRRFRSHGDPSDMPQVNHPETQHSKSITSDLSSNTDDHSGVLRAREIVVELCLWLQADVDLRR